MYILTNWHIMVSYISAISCQLSMSTCQIINDLSNTHDNLKVMFSDNYVVLSDNDVDLIVDLLDIMSTHVI